ncbi:MAG TPA: SWIM zinc finger family protein [Thermoplasmata archaeon]|nr:SWIM zinc finger family protein [Thermoplasmata archaeon]
MLHQRRLDAEGPLGPGANEGRLEVFALLEETTRVSGIGWRLTTAGGPGPVLSRTRRYGHSRIDSELAAVRLGLLDAQRRGCRRVRVSSTEPALGPLLRGEAMPRYSRAAATAARLRPLLDAFTGVGFELTPETDPELAHAVGEALEVGLHRVADQEEHRAAIIEGILERASHVRLARSEAGWIANERYRVSLDPMRCDCPAWTARWRRVPIAGRRSARLPCKHIVALARREGVAVPADLALGARRAMV